MTNSIRPPAGFIEQWPEVFEDLKIEAIPVGYLNKVNVNFVTGMVWEVNIKDYLEDLDEEKIEDMLTELYEEYKDEIRSFEYDFDVEQIKEDVYSLSKKLL